MKQLKHYTTRAALLLATLTLAGCGAQADTDQTPADTMLDGETVGYAAENTVQDATLPSEVEHHGEASDYEWESADELMIQLDGDSAQADTDQVNSTESTVTIETPGTYRLSGELFDGSVVVNTQENGVVRLILDDVTITNSDGPAIAVEQAEKTVIILPDGSESTVTDGGEEVDTEDGVPQAAIASNDDLTIYGSGILTVNGQVSDGVASSDGLLIVDAHIVATATDDTIRGKDYVVAQNANLELDAQGDGISANNEEDENEGNITIVGGASTITSGGDGIVATTAVQLSDTNSSITAGGGSTNTIDDTASAKGIKAGGQVTIDSGSYALDTADDSIHSNQSITVAGGDFVINSGDDAIHADERVEVQDGTIQVDSSYEGIEGAEIAISGGTMSIVSSDDGINVANGADGSGAQGGPGRPGGMETTFTDTGEVGLTISGGEIVLDASGDGIDVNGSMSMSGGSVIVYGPSENMNGAVDYDGAYQHTGGTIIAIGSSGMAMAASSSSQAMALINFDSGYDAGQEITVEADGNEIATLTPTRAYQSILISDSAMTVNGTLDILFDGDLVQSIELTDDITTSGSTGMMGGPGGGGPQGGF